MNVVVIGCGNMGTHHARVFSEFSSLVGVADCDEEKASALAGAHSISSHPPFPPCDVAVIATPTDSHLEVVKSIVGECKGILVEKPLAETEAEAAQIVGIAKAHGATLGVGFVERYNPAVIGLMEAVDASPRMVSFERLSPPGNAYSHVVFDLMVHDLDIALEMFGVPTNIQAIGDYDAAFALVEFGCVKVGFSASRVTHLKRRLVTASMDDRVIVADLLIPEVTVREEVSSAYGEAGYERHTRIGKPRIGNTEPLKAQAKAFLEALENGDEYEPGAHAAMRTTLLASLIVEQL